MSHQDPMPISERELRRLTGDLEDAHHESLPGLQAELTELVEADDELRHGHRLSASRRTFLLGSGAGLGAFVLAACSKSKASNVSSAGSPTTAGGGGQQLSGDLQFIAMSASLENLAVGTYQAAIDAVTAGKLTNVPKAVVAFAQTAQSQHKDHAEAFNGLLTAVGHAKVTQPDMAVKPIVDQAFAQVTDVPGLAKLARLLENTAAATYQAGIGTLENQKAIQTLASIQPVERQHAAILSFVLGDYPVPDAFSRTDKPGEEARPATDFAA